MLKEELRVRSLDDEPAPAEARPLSWWPLKLVALAAGARDMVETTSSETSPLESPIREGQ